MARVFVTGGSGFLGSLLLARLLEDGHAVTNLDLLPCAIAHPNLNSVVGDIRDRPRLDALMRGTGHDVVFHCAALLAHGSLSRKELWSANAEGTRILARAVAEAGIPSLVYISSNCLWGRGFDRPVREDDPPEPCEIYGASKWEGEKILAGHAADFTTTIIRSPTIMDEGRLGLLGILFEFIAEGRRVWVVGDGSNRYQFIYARDLIAAMLLAWQRGCGGTFGIGSDDVGTMRDSYAYVIDRAGSASRVASLPRLPTTVAMTVAHRLKLSPLGPYHARMIGSDFVFDTGRIKAELGWRPTLTNREMLFRAYRYFAANRDEIAARRGVSAHRQAADMGVIRLLKWVS
ncbi:NAD-dependent epimerase/dehydratase family protein [Methylobacterium durans]|uniref:NAD-dependent epimerase/dehydratase family protein n=1 Tax=Methylobacterium durans TaxID=2202825 RepID=UPI002AFFC4E5|nr:NAD-dependent epimerase/dehydratase family protein [Methylobacterium durans]MEA1830911.1 NAD-dependent epimerase/dehydratase family protein [Methylobacterium durans]